MKCHLLDRLVYKDLDLKMISIYCLLLKRLKTMLIKHTKEVWPQSANIVLKNITN